MKPPIEDFPFGKKDAAMHAKIKKERDAISPPCSGGHAFVYSGKPKANMRCLCGLTTYSRRYDA